MGSKQIVNAPTIKNKVFDILKKFYINLSSTLSGSDIVHPVGLSWSKLIVIASVSLFMKIGIRKWNYFGVKKFFFGNFDFINEFKNEFSDNNEKSHNWSRNGVDC